MASSNDDNIVWSGSDLSEMNWEVDWNIPCILVHISERPLLQIVLQAGANASRPQCRSGYQYPVHNGILASLQLVVNVEA